MKISVTKEEYVLDKALKVLQESTFPDVKVGYLIGCPMLVFRYGSETYCRNIKINSISASVRKLADVTNGEFKSKWQNLTEEHDSIVLLEEFSHLIEKEVIFNNLEVTIDL